MSDQIPEDGILKAFANDIDRVKRWLEVIRRLHGNVGHGTDEAIKQLSLPGLELALPLLEFVQDVRSKLENEGIRTLIRERAIRCDATTRFVHSQYLYALALGNETLANVFLERYRVLERENGSAQKLVLEVEQLKLDLPTTIDGLLSQSVESK